MKAGEKIAALVKLGDYVHQLSQQDHHDLFLRAINQNPWFIPPFIKSALSGVSRYLRKDQLEKWIGKYSIGEHRSQRVGLILAGNIPMVGFHDLLSVLLSDHVAHVKLSHQDQILIMALIDKLVEIEPRFQDRVRIVGSLNDVDAIIATGSDNSARYFLSFYQQLPHLIRKNRTSIAILDGNENEDDLFSLSDDIFLYFGMGCRNVSKIFLPEDFNLESLLQPFQNKNWIGKHVKFHHNYIYQQSFARMMNTIFFDGGFYILEKSEKLVSPISVIYYTHYSDLKNLKNSLLFQQGKIQTIVSLNPFFKNGVPFGKAQYPDPWDYADQVDTLDFLLQL